MSDSIADISGNPTAGAQWSFWTDGNGWAPNLTIKNDTKGYALDWDIGVDSSGNSIAVWVQNNNSSFDVYASRYDTQTQLWTTTTLNQNADYWNVENVKISVNAAGNAIVYWERAAPDNLYSKGYTASWYDPEANQWSNSRTLDAIGDNHTLSAKPLIDLDDDGNAIAVWKENSFQAQGVYSSQYNSETRQWGIAQPAGLHDDHYIKALASSTYSAGGILAVWVETEGWITSIYANQYDFTKDRWESAQIIATSDSRVEHSLSLLDTLEIIVDLDGNAIVVWDETKSGGHSQIRSSRYNATTKAWGTPELVASPWSTEPPQLSINTNGNTIAAWDAYVGREINGDPKYALRFSQYDIKNSVWTPAQSTHPSIERSMVDSQIGTNSMGDTFIVWSQYEGSRYRVFSSNLDPQTGAWTNPDVIESNSTPLTSSRGPKIAKGSSTGPVIVWAQDSGSSSNLQWTRFERRVVE